MAQDIALPARLRTPEIDGQSTVGNKSNRGNKNTVHFDQDVLDFLQVYTKAHINL